MSLKIAITKTLYLLKAHRQFERETSISWLLNLVEETGWQRFIP